MLEWYFMIYYVLEYVICYTYLIILIIFNISFKMVLNALKPMHSTMAYCILPYSAKLNFHQLLVQVISQTLCVPYYNISNFKFHKSFILAILIHNQKLVKLKLQQNKAVYSILVKCSPN
jgi:hypothetical protein